MRSLTWGQDGGSIKNMRLLLPLVCGSLVLAAGCGRDSESGTTRHHAEGASKAPAYGPAVFKWTRVRSRVAATT
jgi:hypothetical protein